MDPILLQRVWAAAAETWQHAQQHQQPAAADPTTPLVSSEVASVVAAGYFPVPPPAVSHIHPFGGAGAGQEDVKFELLMTAAASLVIVGVWVVGLLLWYKHCVERPPRLFCGACDARVCVCTCV